MMKRMMTAGAIMLLTMLTVNMTAQTTLVKKSKAKAAIVLADDGEKTRQAADLLQDFVKRISGAELPITTEGQAKGNVFIGSDAEEKVGEDGFSIDTEGGSLYIRSGGDKGATYGVVTLLE
jgi:hypothetical protein